LKKSLIAVVDDDESVRQALSALIRSLGYAVVVFSDAEQLLQSRRRDEITCLISDVQMPRMNGLELYQRLAEEKSVPTILITAYPNDRTQKRAHAMGISCYLAKPFNEDELIGCLRAALGQQA
jgi:FixJ family two-component response regulator